MLTKKEIDRRWRKRNPWSRHMAYVRNRCNYHPDYNGERRNVLILLSIMDIKKLWFRDKAEAMDKPSLNRKNPKKHYTYANCCFMELKENQRQPRHIYARGKGQKTKGRWSIRYYNCIICGKTEFKHTTKGRCARYKCRHTPLADNFKEIVK